MICLLEHEIVNLPNARAMTANNEMVNHCIRFTPAQREVHWWYSAKLITPKPN
jgi:hypothetical protein